MSKKTLKIAIVILAVIVAAELISIAVSRFSEKRSSSENFAGTVTTSTITINEEEIPAYVYKETIYVAAEDLLPFGISVLTNSDSSITVAKTEGAVAEDFKFSSLEDGTNIAYPDYNAFALGKQIQCFTAGSYHLIPAKTIGLFGEKTDSTHFIVSDAAVARQTQESEEEDEDSGESTPEPEPTETSAKAAKGIIVLDPGHGKSSASMSQTEKENEGWVYNSSKGQWGEWRHWKSGTMWQNCEAAGCSGRAPANGSCWYPMGNGDRDKEPQINLRNCLAAKGYLEDMGYTVRLTRTTNDENPSFSKRMTYCYPNNNTTQAPDADLYLCVHSNAGGGSGSAYITLAGTYDQAGISPTYAQDGNTLGRTVNEHIVNDTALSKHGSGSIDFEPELIAFCKSPVTCGYLEIGFFDNSHDLEILNNDYDSIGKAIADGVNEYLTSK